nr:unnamed protein product [Digitaria exilis]
MLIAPATSLNLSIHAHMLSVPTPRTASSIAAATAAHALSNPPAPPPASAALGASANAGPTQLPRVRPGAVVDGEQQAGVLAVATGACRLFGSLVA